MAYPFAPMPTLREFLDRATSEYGAEIKNIDGISGPRGEAPVRYLVRTVSDGRTRFAVIPDLKDNDVLNPSVLRSLCKMLDIPPKYFGLVLD